MTFLEKRSTSMTEKFAIKEAWWLDENGNKREKVIFFEP